MAITTVLIEDTNIRLLVTKGKQVARWASAPLEPGLVSEGVILDEAQVADRIRELFHEAKVGTGKVIFSLSGLNSLYRLITLPEVPEAILPEAIRREAGRVIPASLDEVYLAYQSIPAPAGERRVFLAAFYRNATDGLIRTLRKAGLEPDIMDLTPLALCRTLSELKAIIVSTRLGYLDIIVMIDRVPQVIRSLALPTEAESLSENLTTITEELDRTVTFYNSGHGEEPLDSSVPVFVSGDLAEAPDTWQSLIGRLNCPVSELPSPVKYPEGFSGNKFMVNIGLALKQLSLKQEAAYSSLINFNALPRVYLPKRLPLPKILVPVGIVIGIGALGYFGILIQGATADTVALRSQLVSTESSIAQHVGEIATLNAQIAQLEPQIEPVEATANIFSSTLTSVEEGRAQVDDELGQIVGRLPGNVALVAVNHSGSPVTVSAITPGVIEIFNYARDLRSSGRFSAVIISSIAEYIIQAEDEEEGKEEIKGFTFELLLK